MKLIGLTVTAAALTIIACTAASPSTPGAGDTYELTLIKDFVKQGDHGSSARSHDKDTIIERTVSVRADGLELVYDLPKTATAEERAMAWQLPARIFKPFHGSPQLLNESELEARVEPWLKAAGLPRTACGHLIFTWNAFRIECDPQSVLKTVEAFDLQPSDLRDGAAYQEAGAGGPGTLTKKEAGTDGTIFEVEMPVDPDAILRARAEADVSVGELTRKPISLDAALQKHASEAISGTIVITFDADPAGNVRRRTKVTNVLIKPPNDHSEAQTTTETLERHPI